MCQIKFIGFRESWDCVKLSIKIYFSNKLNLRLILSFFINYFSECQKNIQTIEKIPIKKLVVT